MDGRKEERKEGGEQTRDHEAEPHCVARRLRFLLLTNDDGPCADADGERVREKRQLLSVIDHKRRDAKWSAIVGLKKLFS